MVKTELDAVKEGESVFKLHGKVLVRQELAEARSTVENRLKLIAGEVARTEAKIKDAMKAQDEVRAKIFAMQRAAAGPAAAAAQ